MTLFELLHKVSFDDLIPTLKEVYDVETDIYAYREAFDELNLLRPTGQGDGEIKVYRDEEEHYIGVSGCNDAWENLLDLNIRVEDGIQLDDNALAAYILWELTFYGFSQEEWSSFFTNRKRLDNKYSRKASELYSRKISMYARGRSEKRECFKGAMSLNIIGRIDRRELRRNRAKRMRDARMERSIKRLRRMAKVEDCIQRLLALCPDIKRRNLEYLFETYSITESNFRQQAGDGDYKPVTLCESIFKYSPLPQSEYDSVVIVLYSSDAANVSLSLCSAVEELLITGRHLKRSVIKASSDIRITDGSIRAFIVTSKDEQEV